MDKKLSLSINGKSVELNLGVNWFYEFYKKDSTWYVDDKGNQGHDLVKDPYLDLVEVGSTLLYSAIQSMVWAGHETHAAVTKASVIISREDVTHYVMSLNDTESMDLLHSLISARYGITVEQYKELLTKPVDEKKSHSQVGTKLKKRPSEK